MRARLVFKFLFVILLVVGRPVLAQFQAFEQVPTPPGTDKSVYLHYDPNVDSILYAQVFDFDIETVYGARNIIYKSDDGGDSWSPLLRTSSQGENALVEGVIEVHPTQANTIYLVNDIGLSKSSDGGDSWLDVPLDFSTLLLNGAQVEHLFVTGTNPETLFLQTSDRLLRSSNLGVDWQDVTPPNWATLTEGAFFKFLLPPSSAGHCEHSLAESGLIICPGAEGLKRSTDFGETWNELSIPLGPEPTFMALSPTDPSIIVISDSGTFVNGELVSGEPGIWLSSDQAATWTKTSNDTGSNLTFSRLQDNIIFASTGDESVALISSDGGNSWSRAAPEGLPFLSRNLAFDSGTAIALPSPWNVNQAFVGTTNTGIWRTSDLGATWEKASTGLFAQSFRPSSNQVGTAKIDVLASRRLFSRESGSSNWNNLGYWGYRIPPFPIINDPLDERVLALAESLSVDGGASWGTKGMTGERPAVVLPIPGTDGEELLRRLENGFAYSLDQGASWQTVVEDQSVGMVLDRPRIAVLSSGSSVVFAQGCDFAAPDPQFARSNDNGLSWTVLDGPQLSEAACTPGGTGFFGEIIPKPLQGEEIFLETSEGIFKSGDAGLAWNFYDPLGIGGFSKIAVSRRDANILVAYSDLADQVYYSLDDGSTWSWIEQVTTLVDGRIVHFTTDFIRDIYFDDVNGRIILDVLGLGQVASEVGSLPVSVNITNTAPFEWADQAVDFSVNVSNNSGEPITNLKIEVRDAGELSCTSQQSIDLMPSDEIICQGTYLVKQSDVDAGLASLAAFASGEFQNLTRLTSVGTSTISGLSLPDSSMSQEILDGNLFTRVGEKIVLRIVATNSGNVTLDQLTLVSDSLEQSPFCQPNQFAPEFGLNTPLAPGEKFFCQYEHTITDADITAGELTGTASFSARAPSGELVQRSLPFAVPAGQLALAASPEALDFGEITVGEQSGSVRVNVKNIRDSVVPIQNVTLLVGQGSRFRVSGNTCSGSLPVNGSCGMDVVFTPDIDGLADWDLVIPYDSGDGELFIPLSGTGTSSIVPGTFFVGGSVSGLSGTGLVLQNNLGNALPIVSNGSFVFGNALADGSTYDVTIASQPTNPNQTCSVNNGDGVLSGANVNNIEISCTTESFTVGGTVSGLAGSGLVLQNNLGDNLSIVSNGSFVFGAALTDGSEYDVTVASQPSNPAQTCSVNNGTGVLSGANVTNVEVVCTTDSFTVGGTVAGLAGTGLVLQNNFGDDLSIASNGSFVFDTALPDGSTYDVTVLRDPINPDQICTVDNGSGVLSGANEQNVEVTCMADPDYIFSDSFEVRP